MSGEQVDSVEDTSGSQQTWGDSQGGHGVAMIPGHIARRGGRGTAADLAVSTCSYSIGVEYFLFLACLEWVRIIAADLVTAPTKTY